jgi:hypothetical protein
MQGQDVLPLLVSCQLMRRTKRASETTIVTTAMTAYLTAMAVYQGHE